MKKPFKTWILFYKKFDWTSKLQRYIQ
jgi:hypothetical protein